MANNDDQFKKVVSHAKEYGYIFGSSEIYDGLSAVYDYAQNGVELKKNIRNYWWHSMVHMHQNIVGIDAAILMHPTTWKASGHVDAFNDHLIDNKDSKKRYRADVLIEDYAEKLNIKAQKEIAKAAKRFGDAFNEEEFVTTNPRVLRYREEQKTVLERMARSLEKEDLADVKALIEELGIADPDTGSKNWTEVRQFNLMFGTKLGASADTATDLYLRPETAQGIFVNFLNVQKTGRMKIPFGIAQTGKAFRNEIVARQFIFRMREFEQMEMQFFVRPGDEMKWYEHWKESRLNWHLSLGLQESKLKSHQLNFNHKVQASWLFNLKGSTGSSESISENFSARNYRLDMYEVNPKVSYLLNTQTRFDVFYKFANSDNSLGMKEALKQQNLGFSFAYSNAEKISMNGEFNYIDNNFIGNAFSPVAYQMLEGLQPGTNFTWRLLFQKRITKYLDANLSYFGRKSETANAVHTGTVQLRAFF